MYPRKTQQLSTISEFFSKSLWLVFGCFVFISFASTLYAGYLFIKTSAVDSTKALANDLTSRITVAYNLLEGMSRQPLVRDTSVSVLERAMSLKAYATAFNYWMIGVVDPDGTISSTLRPKIGKVRRDYIPRIISTGRRELSDPFPAGATGEMIYSQFMPIIKDGAVISICFVAVPLAHISKLPSFQALSANGFYLLVDSKFSIIAHPDSGKLLADVRSLTGIENFLFGSDRAAFIDDLNNRRNGTFLSFFENTLYFTAFTNVTDSNWMLIHRVPVLPTLRNILVSFCLQTLLYALFFALLQRHGRNSLSPVDNMFRQVVDLNKSIRKNERLTVENVGDIIELSRRGLYDSLTGLSTRNLFYQKVSEVIKGAPTRPYGIFFFDMDRLKPINDNLGHEAGDRALKDFADKLTAFAEKWDGLACRYGGDEFVLFAPLKKSSEASAMATELLKNMRGSVEGKGKVYTYSTSIGVSLYPFGAFTFDDALRAADMALYKAKRKGRAMYCLHCSEKE